MTSGNNGQKTGRDGKGRFTSNNPGRPKGARHKATQAAEKLLEGEAERLTRQAIDQALAGDTVALRLCLERLVPPRREAAVNVDVPAIETAADLPRALAALLEATGRGEITPGEAERLAKLVGEAGRALELHDLEERLSALEGRESKA